MTRGTIPLLALVNKLANPHISSTDLLHAGLQIQLRVIKKIRSNRVNAEEIGESSARLFSILCDLMARDDAKSLDIVRVIPAILHKMDTPTHPFSKNASQSWLTCPAY
jgi:hypothetical protein